MKWMLQIYPIRRREDWERLRDGLRLAGLPTDTAVFVGGSPGRTQKLALHGTFARISLPDPTQDPAGVAQ